MKLNVDLTELFKYVDQNGGVRLWISRHDTAAHVVDADGNTTFSVQSTNGVQANVDRCVAKLRGPTVRELALKAAERYQTITCGSKSPGHFTTINYRAVSGYRLSSLEIYPLLAAEPTVLPTDSPGTYFILPEGVNPPCKSACPPPTSNCAPSCGTPDGPTESPTDTGLPSRKTAKPG